ncbi:MAG: MipA/OmpV family protein [Gammaproteobacteria bacterium]
MRTAHTCYTPARPKRFSFYIISILLLGVTTTSQAYHLPLWEFGLGAGVLNAPHYRGSKTVENIYLPVPYVIYRGDVFKMDRDGIRGELFQSDRVNLDISLAGNIPVPESDDSARAGMPSLDPLIEIGPELEFKLWENERRGQALWFKAPYRLVFSVGSPIMDHQGWSFSPYLEYKTRIHRPGSLLRYSISIGPIAAGSDYHNYFYEVIPQYATPERDVYRTGSGYSGSRVTMSLARNTKQYFLGFFARYDNLSNAEFVDSPLVETENYFIFGVAFSWIFTSSSEHVPHDE